MIKVVHIDFRCSLKVFIQVLHVFAQENKEVLGPLPLGDIIEKTKQFERTGGYAKPTFILTSLYSSSWKCQGIDTFLSDPEYVKKCHSLASDGQFLYLTNFQSKGLLKMGSGKQGTLRLVCIILGTKIIIINIYEKNIQYLAEVTYQGPLV